MTEPRVLSPRWLVPEDDAEIARTLALYRAFEGRTRRELEEAVAQPPVATSCGVTRELSPRKRALGLTALDRSLRAHVEATVPPRALRDALFAERARSEAPRDEIVDGVAARLGASRDDVEDAIFADLPSERTLAFDGPPPSVAALRAAANRVLAEQLFARSKQIDLRLSGGARAVVRTAQLRGLLVTASRAPSDAQLGLPDLGAGACTTLSISGPFALFRHTRLYAIAARALLPVLSRARFEARVRIPGPVTDWTFRMSSDDPFVAAFAGATPTYDSQIEEAFAKRFARAAPWWELQREPEPIPLASGRLIFPDFRLVERRAPHRSAWLEIVGFWTPEYLTEKLAALRESRLEGLILAVSERLAVGEDRLPDDARIVRFKGRVDPRAVLAHLESA